MASIHELISSIRIEIADREKVIWQDDELIRAVEKSVSLLSRLLPKKEVISGDIEAAWIKGAFLDITNLLPITARLGDSIIRAEYPADRKPPEFIPVEVMGNYLLLKTNVPLKAGETIRLVFNNAWTPPTLQTPGDFPTHLNDVVIIGSAGQALIYKAEHYVQKAADALTAITPPTAPTWTAITPPSAPSLSVLTPPSAPALPDLTPPAKPALNTRFDLATPLECPDAIILATLTPPTPPTLDILTAPTPFSAAIPTSPTLPSVPTAPTAPTLSFTAVETALDKVATEITAAKAYLAIGDPLINKVTVGDKVGETYGAYGTTGAGFARTFVEEALGRLGQIEKTLEKYAREVTAFGSEVNGYANEVSAIVSKYRGDIEGQTLGINDYSTDIYSYATQIQEEGLKVSKYAEEVRGYVAEVNEENLKVNNYAEQVRTYASQINEEVMKISLYAEDIRKYGAEISEYNATIAHYQQEITQYQSEIAEENLKISLYGAEVEGFNAKVNEQTQKVNIFTGEINNYSAQAGEQEMKARNFLEIAGRFLASGQSKVNEMLSALGYKVEMFKPMMSAEQRH